MEKASETEIIDDINLETWRKFFRMPRDRKIKRFGYKLFDYKLPRIFFGTEKQIPFLVLLIIVIDERDLFRLLVIIIDKKNFYFIHS